MTLVPAEESGNTSVKSLDDRRVYELWPSASDFKSATITDFEGRTLSRTANSLEINGHAARVTVRCDFDPVTSVTLGIRPLRCIPMPAVAMSNSITPAAACFTGSRNAAGTGRS